MKKNAEEITAEIAKLKEMKPNVRETNAFGESHHEAIDGQIEALEGGFNEEKIYDLNDGAADDELWSADNVRDQALRAVQWAAGDEETAPSVEWQELVKK